MALPRESVNPPIRMGDAGKVWKAELSETSNSLLIRARQGEEEAWQHLVALYRPLILGWLKYQAVPAQDVEDTTQEILIAVVRNLSSFSHSGHRGAFRAWLRAITFHEICDYWKKRRRLSLASSDLAAAELALLQLQDDHENLARIWDQEHDRYVLKSLLESLKSEFTPESARIFRRIALDDVPAPQVALESNLSIGAVYTVKSRVLRRLREVARELIDGFQ